MTDSVKFIFKTLIKVPIFIFVAFLILNIFAIAFIYFKMLGLSYVVMQTAVENNYLPDSEVSMILSYLNEMSNGIEMVTDAGIVIEQSSTPTGSGYVVKANGTDYVVVNTYAGGGLSGGALTRHQYGREVVCGVYCNYKIIWPLDYRYTGNRSAIVNSADGQYTYQDVQGYKAGAQTHTSYISAFANLPIAIVYKVPGLKYYPDMFM